MSLLNQVLQDLDGRGGSDCRPVLRLAGAVPRAQPPSDVVARRRSGPLRAGVVAILIGSLALVFYLGERGIERLDGNEIPVDIAPLTLPSPVARAAQAPVRLTSVGTKGPGIVGAAGTASGEDTPTAEIAGSVPDTAVAPPPAPSPGSAAGVEPPDASAAPMLAADEPTPDFLPLRNVELPHDPMVEDHRTPARAPLSIHSVASPRVKAATPVSPLVDVRQMIDNGDLINAEARLIQHLQRQPASREGRELLLGLMLRDARYEAATRQLEIGLHHHPRHAAFALIEARLLIQQGDNEAALEALERQRRPGRSTPEILQMLGALYQQASRYRAATEVYGELTRRQPDSGPAWVGLAITLDADGEPGASDAYRRALRLGGLPQAAADYAAQRLVVLGDVDG